MAKNDFKPFATGVSANVITQAEYEALTALLTGFQAGKASSAQINKAIRQATFVAAALAQYITNKTGQDVPDNGDIAAFITKMAAALGKDFQALDAALTSLAALPGTADTLAYFTGPDTLALTNLTAAGRNLINKADVASIIQYLGLQNTITQAANSVQRIGDTMSWLNVTGLIQSASMRVNTPASPSVQGLTIDWNGIGFGTAGLTNNRGLGTGGFIFRTVDAENKNEYGRVTFNEVGEIFAGRNIYAGPAKYAIDGNSYGTIWGTGGNSEWLSNNLNARFGAIPVNNTTGDVNGTAWGGSLAVNLTARFNDLQSKISAIPVDNASGNIRGSVWGNDWLSNYLSNKFNGIQGQFSAIPVNNATGDISGPAWGGLLSAHLASKWLGIQNQFNAIPVDNPSGNIHGSAWGNDWLSNWLAAQFSARDSNINTRATFDWVTANYLPRVQNYATVGTFILAYYNGGNIDPEAIVSGGNLFPSTADGLAATWSLPGSWRCAGMSRTVNDAHRTTLWQRVA
ncbi:hypothetical protein SAMN03159434_102472 [Enterobacter sp. NFR05]|nr:hypothetical protein SAMN03159434_102472 [Enterobacter sp. NFR05]